MRVDRIDEILERDPRYPQEAYEFIFQSLAYSQQRLRRKNPGSEPGEQRHVTAAELSESACEFALDQFGMLAPTVLGLWNVKTTGDLGNLVYNLIEAGEMSASPEDRRENFDDLFDLHQSLTAGFVMAIEED